MLMPLMSPPPPMRQASEHDSLHVAAAAIPSPAIPICRELALDPEAEDAEADAGKLPRAGGRQADRHPFTRPAPFSYGYQSVRLTPLASMSRESR
jgi:hypothetical protein